jgi:hypothetical protein
MNGYSLEKLEELFFWGNKTTVVVKEKTLEERVEHLVARLAFFVYDVKESLHKWVDKSTGLMKTKRTLPNNTHDYDLINNSCPYISTDRISILAELWLGRINIAYVFEKGVLHSCNDDMILNLKTNKDLEDAVHAHREAAMSFVSNLCTRMACQTDENEHHDEKQKEEEEEEANKILLFTPIDDEEICIFPVVENLLEIVSRNNTENSLYLLQVLIKKGLLVFTMYGMFCSSHKHCLFRDSICCGNTIIVEYLVCKYHERVPVVLNDNSVAEWVRDALCETILQEQVSVLKVLLHTLNELVATDANKTKCLYSTYSTLLWSVSNAQTHYFSTFRKESIQITNVNIVSCILDHIDHKYIVEVEQERVPPPEQIRIKRTFLFGLIHDAVEECRLDFLKVVIQWACASKPFQTYLANMHKKMSVVEKEETYGALVNRILINSPILTNEEHLEMIELMEQVWPIENFTPTQIKLVQELKLKSEQVCIELVLQVILAHTEKIQCADLCDVTEEQKMWMSQHPSNVLGRVYTNGIVLLNSIRKNDD